MADFDSATSPTIPCRLCGGEASFIFKKLVLQEHEVSYFRCGSCGSMQTERPYWLDEAYAIPGVHVDVGIGSRTIKNWAALASLFLELGYDKKSLVVDFGAASGLLARLMRDVGFDMRSCDKYSIPSFTNCFNVESIRRVKPKVITAFEVFEHFENPSADLDGLFQCEPELVVFTTWFCDGQPNDWIYFIPESGQHVFFYSENAMRDYAGERGYSLVLTSFFHVLVRQDMATEFAAKLESYRHNAMEIVRGRILQLFDLVSFGNAYIDEDSRLAFEVLRSWLDSGRRNEGIVDFNTYASETMAEVLAEVDNISGNPLSGTGPCVVKAPSGHDASIAKLVDQVHDYAKRLTIAARDLEARDAYIAKLVEQVNDYASRLKLAPDDH